MSAGASRRRRCRAGRARARARRRSGRCESKRTCRRQSQSTGQAETRRRRPQGGLARRRFVSQCRFGHRQILRECPTQSRRDSKTRAAASTRRRAIACAARRSRRSTQRKTAARRPLRECVDDAAHVLRAAARADQYRIGAVDDDEVVGAEHRHQPRRRRTRPCRGSRSTASRPRPGVAGARRCPTAPASRPSCRRRSSRRSPRPRRHARRAPSARRRWTPPASAGNARARLGRHRAPRGGEAVHHPRHRRGVALERGCAAPPRATRTFPSSTGSVAMRGTAAPSRGRASRRNAPPSGRAACRGAAPRRSRYTRTRSRERSAECRM